METNIKSMSEEKSDEIITTTDDITGQYCIIHRRRTWKIFF